MITLQLEPYDGFLTNLDENGNIISFNSDISLLQRKDIVEMLPNSLDALFDSNASNNPYDGMHDDEIFSLTKSRRVQSPSELKAWSDALKEDANFEVAKANANSKSKSINPSDSVPDNVSSKSDLL